MEETVTPSPLTADTRGILNPQRGAAHFSLTRHVPSPEVAERVERHWIVRWDLRGRSPYTQDVLPHPCVNLVFAEGEGRVYGIVPAKFSRRLEGEGMAVGTKFRAGAFAAFVDLPMSRLVGRSLSLTEAFGEDGGRRGARPHAPGPRAGLLRPRALHATLPPGGRALADRLPARGRRCL